MAIIKCKMCGGDLDIAAGASVGTCEYCGTTQTLPTAGDEMLKNLFNRANALRLKCEFDKAEQIYEKIVQQKEEEAEAHWGIVLCKYGIEYVEDPKSFKRIPTCHRTSYDAVTADADYLAAIKYADAQQKELYAAEAKAIDEIQKNILSIVKDEKPFDVFICYKETDENGKRTMDSVIANDIYHQLTQEGLKVFYAAITLEDKLGQEYEPYIFAALNSAKVMLVVGTMPHYFTAVWVKNEWSRFMKLMQSDRSKLLIPCYKDMDAYELPEEFAHLQAQDMGKIGFINDVVRGIKKVTAKDEPKPTVVQKTVVAGSNTNIAPLLQRAFMFLEDRDWSSATEYCEKVLDLEPQNASAYLGKLMAEQKASSRESLKECAQPFDRNNNYQKAVRFGDEQLKAELQSYIEHINTRNEQDRMDGIYMIAKNAMSQATAESAYKEAAKLFETIAEYQDAADLAQLCYEKAEVTRKDAVLATGKKKMIGEVLSRYEAAIKLFESISGWKDADEQIIACQKKIEEIKVKEEANRLEREREAEIARIKAQQKKKIAIFGAFIIFVIFAFIILLTTVIIPNSKYNSKYNNAIKLMEAGKYDEAIEAFTALDGYKDSTDQIKSCRTAILDGKYNDSVKLMEAGKYDKAIAAFTELDGYKDSIDQVKNCETAILEGKYKDAVKLMEAGKKAEAAMAFDAAGKYMDAQERSFALWDEIAVRETISAGRYHTVGLKSDGTVVAVGDNLYGRRDVDGWNNIVAVSAGYYHTVGLKPDGTVVAVGYYVDGQCDVADWTDIVAVSAGANHTVGLKSDGTVVAVGANGSGQCDVADWTDIVAVSAGGSHTVGLKSDGTVIAVGYNDDSRCDVNGWKDIVAISAGDYHTVGLKSDGTVVAVGYNKNDQCDVDDWKDIVAVSAGYKHTVGLKSDGTVIAVGYNDDGECVVDDWKDIVVISAGDYHTVGLKSDGTVVAVGDDDCGQCDVYDWKDIKTD